jgi:hypothetical protein
MASKVSRLRPPRAERRTASSTGLPSASARVETRPLRRTRAIRSPEGSASRAPTRKSAILCVCASGVVSGIPKRKPTMARSVVLLPASFGP